MSRRVCEGIFVVLVGLTASTALAGCASGGSGNAIPIELYKEEPDPNQGEYIIADGDLLAVQVFDQPNLSTRIRVRNDGRIALPLVNEVMAAGKTPAKLASELEEALKAVVLTPKVTVVVEDSRPLTISVLGEVNKAGQQPFVRNSGLADVLSSAGGLTTFAHKDRIFVVRSNPKPVRIRFTYKGLIEDVGVATTFKLRPGDVVIVE
jgi:polysaccharide biosynthesis/export protein